jgi:tripartite-type tricarboxylate transporter receptor subunit TctC
MALHRTSLRVGFGFAFGLALSVCLAPASGHAQKYPDHPVKVVIGFTAGGGTDVAGRIIAQKLSEATGQTFVVENRAGASGLLASEQVAKAAADGYTIMVGSQTTLAVAPALYKKFQLDVTKELTGMAMIGISPLVAVVNADSPIKSIKDLIAEAKAKNGAKRRASTICSAGRSRSCSPTCRS